MNMIPCQWSGGSRMIDWLIDWFVCWLCASMRRKFTSLEVCLSVISVLLSLCCIGLIVYVCIGLKDEGTAKHCCPVNLSVRGCHWSACCCRVQVKARQSRWGWVDGWWSNREQSSPKSWRTPAARPSNPSPSTSRTWWGHMIFILKTAESCSSYCERQRASGIWLSVFIQIVQRYKWCKTRAMK